MLMRPDVHSFINERDVVVVQELVGRRAVGRRRFFVQEFDLERLVDVGRIVVARSALVFFPMEYERVGVEQIEDERLVRDRDTPVRLDAEQSGGSGSKSRFSNLNGVVAAGQPEEAELAVDIRRGGFQTPALVSTTSTSPNAPQSSHASWTWPTKEPLSAPVGVSTYSGCPV